MPDVTRDAARSGASLPSDDSALCCCAARSRRFAARLRSFSMACAFHLAIWSAGGGAKHGFHRDLPVDPF
jgi:hypothetical protein